MQGKVGATGGVGVGLLNKETRKPGRRKRSLFIVAADVSRLAFSEYFE